MRICRPGKEGKIKDGEEQTSSSVVSAFRVSRRRPESVYGGVDDDSLSFLLHLLLLVAGNLAVIPKSSS